jgi:hypothetical protein
MNGLQIVSIISGGIFLGGYLPYITAIWKGKAKPIKTTWIVWFILDCVTLLSMTSQNAFNFQILGAVIGAGLVMTLSFFKGVPGWTKIDLLCLIGAGIGIFLLIIVQKPELALLSSILSIFIGAIPTFISAWKEPSRENKTAWFLFWLSCVLAIIAIPKWNLENSLQPLTFFTINTLMLIIFIIAKRKGTL